MPGRMILILLTLAVSAAAQPKPRDSLIPAVNAVVKDYRAAIADADKTHESATLSAWRQADLRLEDILKETMKRGDLEEANRISSLRREMEAASIGTISPPVKPADPPRSTAARGIKVELTAANQKLETEHNAAVEKAAKSAIDALDQAVKAALKEGNLDDANRINAYKRQFEVQLKLAGRFPTGALAIYTFDRDTFFKKDNKEFIRDISGNDNHLLAQNAKPIPGRVGLAISFSGPESKLVSQNPIAIAGAAPRSVCFWNYYDPAPFGHWKHFLGWGEAANKKAFFASTYEGAYMLWAHGFGNDWTFNAKADLKAWHHHVITYDGKAAQWHIDGKPQAKGFEIEYETAAGPLTLGSRIVVLDEVAIYDRVLTAEEIKQLRNRPENK